MYVGAWFLVAGASTAADASVAMQQQLHRRHCRCGYHRRHLQKGRRVREMREIRDLIFNRTCTYATCCLILSFSFQIWGFPVQLLDRDEDLGYIRRWDKRKASSGIFVFFFFAKFLNHDASLWIEIGRMPLHECMCAHDTLPLIKIERPHLNVFIRGIPSPTHKSHSESISNNTKNLNQLVLHQEKLHIQHTKIGYKIFLN